MTDEELKSYFVEYPIPMEDSKNLTSGAQNSVLCAPVKAIASFIKTGNTDWLWGLVYPIIIAYILTRHPVYAKMVYAKFL